MSGVSRRNLFRLAGGATVMGTVVAAGARTGQATAASGPTASDWRALAASLDGDLVTPDSATYYGVRVVNNSRFDSRRPLAIVRAAGRADVAESIRFAQRFDLPTRSRAGGHSYVGDSTLNGGLVIDVRRMRSVRYDSGSREVLVGAGAATYPLLRALASRGRSIPTGTCPTVGLVGLALGGGLGIDSRRLGLTCDRLTGLTMVTADARVRHVRPGDSLMWASQGGGGGVFGVVTSLRLRTHAAGPMGLFSLDFPWTQAAAVVRGWARHVQGMPRSVWCNLQLVVTPDGSRLVRVLGRCRPGDQKGAAQAVERAVRLEASSVWTARKPFLEAVEFFGGGRTSPRRAYVAGSDVLSSLSAPVSEAFRPLLEQRVGSGTSSRVILDPLTGAVQDRSPGATAFPWRRHLAEVQWYTVFPSTPSAGDVDTAHQWLSQAHHAVSGDSAGAYINRVEPGRFSADYYAGNLNRLHRIKTRFDPDNFFQRSYPI